jgi:tetratricopeptide (TPR) repeat protein
VNSKHNLFTIDNKISRDIRNLFPEIKEPVNPEQLTTNIIIDQYLEKTDEIAQLNLIASGEPLKDLSQILKIDDFNLQGIAWACIGGIHTFNGNYKNAFTSFNMALDLNININVKSYMYTELSNLLRKLGYAKESIAILNAAASLCSNEKLNWRINSLLGLCHKFLNPELALELLTKSAEYYKENNEYFRYANALRNIGELYLNKYDYNTTADMYNQAKLIAQKHGLIQIEFEITNDEGWLLIMKKEINKARTLFTNLIQKEISPYHLSLALQNLGYLEFEDRNYRSAINYHSQSLQLNLKYDMRDMAFEDYYKLGNAYEKLKEEGLAYHFYSQGYALLQTEMDLGLPILGYRKIVVDSYIEFLSNNQKLPYVNSLDEALSFVIGKPMKEIRNFFHKALLTMQIRRHKNAPVLCKALDIDTRTYFLYQKKLNLKRGQYNDTNLFSSQYFRQYIETLQPYTWREANNRFEEDLFKFLMEKYQHNKKKIAEVLEVSYPQVVMKTVEKRN